MGRLEIRPQFLLMAAPLLGLLVILGILATGARAEDETGPIIEVDPVAQQRTLETLQTQLDEIIENQFPTLAEAQENAFELFSLAQEHGVAVTSLVNSDPQSVKLGPMNIQKLLSTVEIRGPRSDTIDMLSNLQDSMLISNVNVNGTPEDWAIQFVLTQYLR